MFSRQIFSGHTAIRPAFVAEFIKREAHAPSHGKAGTVGDAAWLGVSGMTVWEYLLLHTDTLADRDEVLASLLKLAGGAWASANGFVSCLAWADLQSIKNGRTFAETRELLEFQINCSRYVGGRCRAYFAIPFWDVMALLAIARYRSEYARAMWAELDRLRPA